MQVHEKHPENIEKLRHNIIPQISQREQAGFFSAKEITVPEAVKNEDRKGIVRLLLKVGGVSLLLCGVMK